MQQSNIMVVPDRSRIYFDFTKIAGQSRLSQSKLERQSADVIFSTKPFIPCGSNSDVDTYTFSPV